MLDLFFFDSLNEQTAKPGPLLLHVQFNVGACDPCSYFHNYLITCTSVCERDYYKENFHTLNPSLLMQLITLRNGPF